MKSEYNSRQRKIYQDYKGFSTDKLFEIVRNSNKYIPEVIEIINDILIERNAIFPPAERGGSERPYDTSSEPGAREQELLSAADRHKKDETLKSLIPRLKEKSDSDISGIITRYILYEPETVEAALFISVERGLISFDLKEQLLKQIEANFISHRKNLKQNKWENNNAFVKYVSCYQDDEIYNIIEDPSDIAMDVYHAILLTAKERELISEDDFTRFYKDAKAAVRSEDEIKKDEFNEFFGTDSISNDFEKETELEAENEKYWKCPSCGHLVGMEFGVCWNCQAEVPDSVEHPDKEEIIKEIVSQRTFNPVKTGFILIIFGTMICLLTIGRGYSFDDYLHFRYGRFFFGALAGLAGAGFVIWGIFFKARD